MDDVEQDLRARLKKHARMRTTKAFRELGILKATTVHQEFRVLRRALNVGVRKKFLWANRCLGVEVRVSILELFRPHYVTWPEQQLIEFHAPENLRNVVRIITERINLDEKRSIGGRTNRRVLIRSVSWNFDTVSTRFRSSCGCHIAGGSESARSPDLELGQLRPYREKQQ